MDFPSAGIDELMTMDFGLLATSIEVKSLYRRRRTASEGAASGFVAQNDLDGEAPSDRMRPRRGSRLSVSARTSCSLRTLGLSSRCRSTADAGPQQEPQDEAETEIPKNVR